jgi:hypothetical protein
MVASSVPRRCAKVDCSAAGHVGRAIVEMAIDGKSADDWGEGLVSGAANVAPASRTDPRSTSPTAQTSRGGDACREKLVQIDGDAG